MERGQSTRRSYIKQLGVTGAVFGTGALAGCTGGQSGSEGDGDQSGTDGSGETRTIRITMGPGGFQGPVVDYIANQTSVLQDRIENAGDYSVEIQPSWEGASLFASGGPDFAGIGPLEAAELGSERDLELAVNAKVAPNFVTWWVENGGPYDPEETGSVQASIDKMYADGARHAHGSWGSGHVAADKYIHQEVFGHTFEEGGDLDVVTSSYSAIPQLIMDGELDSGAGWFNTNTQQVQDPPGLTSLYTCVDTVRNNDLGTNTLNAWTTTQEFAENNPEAVQAFVEAWQEGMNWLFDAPMERFQESEDYREQIQAETVEEAEWSVEWALLGGHDTEFPVVYEDVSMGDEWIESNKEFIDNAAALGQVSEDWQDHISYRQVL